MELINFELLAGFISSYAFVMGCGFVFASILILISYGIYKAFSLVNL